MKPAAAADLNESFPGANATRYPPDSPYCCTKRFHVHQAAELLAFRIHRGRQVDPATSVMSSKKNLGGEPSYPLAHNLNQTPSVATHATSTYSMYVTREAPRTFA